MSNMIPVWIDGDLVPMEKLEVHRKGLLHKAVSVFVLCGDELLIQRRALAKYHTPGLWANTCCTHPNWRETPEDCAHRRLYEELGIKGLSLEHRDRVTYRADVGGGLWEHERVDLFVSRVKERVGVIPNPDEVMDTQWIEMGRLREQCERTPDKFTPWLRIYLKDHTDQIFTGSQSAI